MNLLPGALLFYSVFLMLLDCSSAAGSRAPRTFWVAGRSLGAGRILRRFWQRISVQVRRLGRRVWGIGSAFGVVVGRSASIGTLLLSQFLGPKLWRMAKEHGLATLPDFLEFRYGKAVKAIISVLFWFGAMAILAAQLIAILGF